jgi:hypothetical protein
MLDLCGLLAVPDHVLEARRWVQAGVVCRRRRGRDTRTASQAAANSSLSLSSSSMCAMDGNMASKIEHGEAVAWCRQRAAAAEGVLCRRRRIRRPRRRPVRRRRTCSRTRTGASCAYASVSCSAAPARRRAEPETRSNPSLRNAALCLVRMLISFASKFSLRKRSGTRPPGHGSAPTTRTRRASSPYPHCEAAVCRFSTSFRFTAPSPPTAPSCTPSHPKKGYNPFPPSVLHADGAPHRRPRTYSSSFSTSSLPCWVPGHYLTRTEVPTTSTPTQSPVVSSPPSPATSEQNRPRVLRARASRDEPHDLLAKLPPAAGRDEREAPLPLCSQRLGASPAAGASARAWAR